MLSNRIYEKLKKCRSDNNLTQEQVAEHLHATRQAVSKWENGINDPDLLTIVCLCDLYHVTLDFLLRDDAVLVHNLAHKERSFKKLVVSVAVLAGLLLLILMSTDVSFIPSV